MVRQLCILPGPLDTGPGVEVDVLPIRGYVSGWEYVRGAVDMLLERTFYCQHDIVHAHYGHSAVVARLGVIRPLVVSYCGDDLLGTPSAGNPTRMTRGSRVLAGAFAQFARLASATITKSEQMAVELPRRVRGRNHVIPNGVDLEMFKPMDQLQARARVGWDPDQKVVCSRATPRTRVRITPLRSGRGELAARRCPAVRLHLATRIAPDMIPVWMSAADALIHPSWSEGSPNVVKEAMACELPIVATPVGDVRERLTGIPGCHVVRRMSGCSPMRCWMR